MISKRNHKLESAVQGVANGVNTAKLAKESHLRRRKRMRLAVMPADVWVYKSTVYNTKGTTWLGSPLWKQAQQEVRQHWFYCLINSSLLYIQVLYTGGGVHPTGRTVTRDVGRCPQSLTFHKWTFCYFLCTITKMTVDIVSGINILCDRWISGHTRNDIQMTHWNALRLNPPTAGYCKHPQ